MAFQDMFAPATDLVAADASVVPATSLASRTLVGLYFSAGWCRPCKAFLPKLLSFYDKHKTKGFEIVFVSQDFDQEGYDLYRQHLPWLALPFEYRDTNAKLLQTFLVLGFPCLVLCTPDGRVVSRRGKELVTSAPTAYPWLSTSTPLHRDEDAPPEHATSLPSYHC